MRTIDGFHRPAASWGAQAWSFLVLAGAMLILLGAPAARAEGIQADSDDYNCNHGAPDDPTTIEACNRLRGTSRGAGADVGHQYNSDDYNCNHGDPNDPATLAACQRLRGTTYGVGADQGHQRNSDDYNCNHGDRDDPATIAACERLRGGYAVAGRHGGYLVAHVVRDYGAARHIGGRAYRSARYAIEFDCAAGERRRIGYVLYSGHGASGARVGAARVTGAWRAIPPGAMPYACR
ncbi:MAG TPA: surface-adhesin E family protein [Caulobacteraceae bacterium]|nr:surface-adhesin E family protein [Caulobacteraceae bacterium]